MEPDRNLGCGENSAAADGLIDDEKVDKFYELIRNYKEARDRHAMAMQRLQAAGVSDSERRMKKLKSGDGEKSIWTPAFKWEDFTPPEQRCWSVIPSGEIEKERRMREDGKDSTPAADDLDGGGLDLNLKL